MWGKWKNLVKRVKNKKIGKSLKSGKFGTCNLKLRYKDKLREKTKP